MNRIQTVADIDERLKSGVTTREGELWLADEMEHLARLLRREEPHDTAIATFVNGIAKVRKIIITIEACVLVRGNDF